MPQQRNPHRSHGALRGGLGAAAAIAILLVLSTPSRGGSPASWKHGPARSQSCLEPGARCSLAEAARESGIFIGAAVGNGIPSDEAAGVLAHFNAITTENAFKWSEMSDADGVYDFTFTDQLVDWARKHRLRLRAHTLFWHRFQLPEFVYEAVAEADDPAARLRELMAQRVHTVVGRYRGRIDIYDVVNEPLELLGPGFDLRDSAFSRANLFYNTLGTAYIAEAFRLVHRVDSRARLFLNEIVYDPRLGDAKADAFLELVRDLVAQGVPIHGVGIQTHANLGVQPAFFPSSVESFREYMDAFADLGLRVEITELDVPLTVLFGSEDPLATQAELFGRVVRACALARRCSGVTTWGVHDGRTWLDDFFFLAAMAPNEPLLLDASLRPKPAYFAVRDALLERCQPPRSGRIFRRLLWHRLRRLGVPCSRPYPRPFPPRRR